MGCGSEARNGYTKNTRQALVLLKRETSSESLRRILVNRATNRDFVLYDVGQLRQ